MREGRKAQGRDSRGICNRQTGGPFGLLPSSALSEYILDKLEHGQVPVVCLGVRGWVQTLYWSLTIFMTRYVRLPLCTLLITSGWRPL